MPVRVLMAPSWAYSWAYMGGRRGRIEYMGGVYRWA